MENNDEPLKGYSSSLYAHMFVRGWPWKRPKVTMSTANRTYEPAWMRFSWQHWGWNISYYIQDSANPGTKP